MKYKHYNAEDFFNDDNFRNWILKDDPELNYFWDKWCIQNPNKKQDIMIAKKLVMNLNFREDQISDNQKKEIWNRIQKENRQFDQSINNKNKVLPLNGTETYQTKGRDFSYYFYRIAAGILFLLVSFYLLNNSKSEESAITTNLLEVKENPPGQKSKIYLADGSVVYLNANSKISYFENFEANRRLIYLEGEAFFEVAKDSLKPFIVASGSLQTKALGTKFNVAAFSDDKNITVSLLEGKVEVKDEKSDQSIILKDRQAASFNRSINKLNKASFSYFESVLWKDGILYFHRTPLEEVIAELERWYGADISVTGYSDEPVFISGRFENESMVNVLQSISFSGDFEYEINGKKVNINF